MPQVPHSAIMTDLCKTAFHIQLVNIWGGGGGGGGGEGGVGLSVCDIFVIVLCDHLQ